MTVHLAILDPIPLHDGTPTPSTNVSPTYTLNSGTGTILGQGARPRAPKLGM